MKCFECENDFNDESLVRCDGCKRYVCLQCSKLTSSKARVIGLKRKRKVLYLCTQCREALFQVPKLIKSYDAMREELDEVKNLISQSRNPTVASASSVAAPAAAVSSPHLNTNAIMEEIMQCERRANNVVLVGIEESGSDNGNVRKSHS